MHSTSACSCWQSQYQPVTPAVKRKRRQDPGQATFEFRPSGRGGARPGAGRRRSRRSRVPHRTREDIPRDCPVLVTLRVLDDVPPLRRAGFVRAFRESLRQAAERPGFRVAHYSVQDNHAHFLVEADDKRSLANGMKSLGARFARCVNRVCRRSGRVLATRFHHVVKRTPTEVRNALAYGAVLRASGQPARPTRWLPHSHSLRPRRMSVITHQGFVVHPGFVRGASVSTAPRRRPGTAKRRRWLFGVARGRRYSPLNSGSIPAR